MIGKSTIAAFEELYPFGIPQRVIDEALMAGEALQQGAGAQSANLISFSGPSAARFALLYRTPYGAVDRVRETVTKAITQGLKRAMQEVLVGECVPKATRVSLEHASPKVVLACLPPEIEIVDAGDAVVIRTQEMVRVTEDLAAKRLFWTALQGAWELSQR